jgi:YVTN family beta-propeller protein
MSPSHAARLATLLPFALQAACSDGTHDRGEIHPEPERANRFYVANTESESITVLDHRTRSVLRTIDVGNRPHGHAPAATGEWIYATTDGGLGEVLAIDTSTDAVAWRMEVGSEMNEPHLTRDDRFLYAPDLLAGKVVVVDVTARTVRAEIDMVAEDGAPLIALHNTYASHDGRHMYVTAILSQTIVEIDTATREISRRFVLGGDPRPAAITHDDRKMYVQLSEHHGFIELDLESGEESRRVTWPIPDVLPPEYGEAGSLPTMCHGIGISPDGSTLWAATNLEGAVYVYSLPELERVARIEVGSWPNWVAFSSDGRTAYVTNSELSAPNGSVSVVDTGTHEVRATLPVGRIPKRIHRVELPADG